MVILAQEPNLTGFIMTAAQTKNVRNNTPLKRGKKKVVWAYRSKWLSLTRAIKHLQTTLKISEQEAWLNIQQVIADGQLNARGLADGVRSDLQTTWLSILMWNDPRGDVLWFKEDKRMQASAPRRIEQIEIDGEQLSQFFEKKVPNLNLKHQTIVRKTPGRPKGVGAINDQKALDRIKELHAAY